MKRKKNAFTLVEMLVVIGIIGLLVGIMLPAMLRARATARQAQCASNLRQFYVAQMLFAHDARGRLAGVEWDQQLTWTARLSKYLGRNGTTPKDLAQCPSTPFEALDEEAFHLPHMSYGINSHMMLPNWSTRRDAKMNASDIILMGDKPLSYEQWLYSEDGCYYYAQAMPDAPDGIITQVQSHRGTLSRRHGKLANVVMMDGHVAALGARELDEHAGHWYWGEPKTYLWELPYCPCCGN